MTRTTLALLAAALVVPATPGVAYHLSAGASDVVAPLGVETPGDPSVHRPTYETGTRTDCPSGPPGSGGGDRDPVCGELVYHEGTELEQVSPRDQVLAEPAAAFDVQVTHYSGSRGFETCLPWCNGASGGGIYDVVNRRMASGGVGDDRADERDGGWQRYGADLHAMHATALVDEGVGAWRGNGWLPPSTEISFVGFLEAGGGDPITPSDLEAIAASSRFPVDAIPTVCGFTPESDLDTRASRPGCEIPFEWTPASGADRDSPCRGQAYVCGATTPAWQAQVVCSAATAGCRAPNEAVDPGSPEQARVPRDPTMARPDPDRPADSTIDPSVWHFVALPSPSDCRGRQEPGFAVEPGTSAPFLAHDLDVYATATGLAFGRGALIVEPATTARGSLHAGDAVASQVWTTATDSAWQTRPSEPTTDAEPAGLGDTSGTVEVDRRWRDCRRTWDPAETPDTLDPWTNVVDGWLQRDPAGNRVEGSIEAPDSGGRARTGWYTPTGYVGMFADTDDDGADNRVPWQDQFDRITRTGAYPVLWDMRTDGRGTVTPNEGCRVGDQGGPRLSRAMVDGGYGKDTGLVQALALHGPAVFEHRLTGARVAEPGGGVFVLASQVPNDRVATPFPDEVQQRVQGAVRAAAAHAGLSDPPVTYLNQRLQDQADHPPFTDYQAQCGEPTGGFTSAWSLLRACAGPTACQQDAMVTRALIDVEDPHAAGSHGTWIDRLPVGHAQAFPEGLSAWTDVDRLQADG